MSDTPFRLAILGMIPGNGHPYSWGAIVNGYDEEAMARCPYPVIPQYLGSHPNRGFPDARVTHLWTDDPAEASLVAKAARIPHQAARPEDVIGQVDGIIIATDDGDDHVRRAAPFIEAGLPVFIDKPLATNPEDLARFARWHDAGARFLSTSGMRYAPELDTLPDEAWHWITAATPKSWERYGIHLLDPLHRILGPGFESVRLVRHRDDRDHAEIRHASGAVLSLAATGAALGDAFAFTFHGGKDARRIKLSDTYTAFRRQLRAAVDWMQDGAAPVPFSATRELMAVLIAGRQSRRRQSNKMPAERVGL